MRLVATFLVLFTIEPAFPQRDLPVREFEVVSVREVPELLTMEELTRNPQARLASITPAQVRMPYESMKSLLLQAFGVASQAQLFAPEWINSKHYSIEAKLPPGTNTQDVPEMFRTMLSVRFGLIYHTEMRIVPAVFLTLRKGGLKASIATPDSKRALRPLSQPGATHYELPMTMTEFAQSLTQKLALPVFDNTGVDRSGSPVRYMFAFDVYSRGRPGDDRGAPADYMTKTIGIHDDALAPLGLHLELKRTELESFIIDRLSIKPTEN